ncbi:RNA polymerase II associated protein 1 [Mactra antiquata]
MSTTSCFTSNIEEFLMPQDWIFSPLIELYNTFMSVGGDVQNVLSNSQLDVVRNVLRWIYVVETCRPVMLEGVSVTLRISRIMCTFLTGNEMFLDHSVHKYLAGLLRTYTQSSLLKKIDFSQDIPGLPSFYDLFTCLVQQFEAVSFGDTVFACYLLLPLQQRFDIKYRKAIWLEYTGVLRTLSLPLNQLMLPMEMFLDPEETNVELLRLYYQSLLSGKLQPKWSPVLYLIAVHHVNRFIYTQDKIHQKLKNAMIKELHRSSNEELKQHMVYYMKTDLSKPFGMTLYETLPDIRQMYMNNILQ